MASILLITPDRSFADYATQVLTAGGHEVVPEGTPESAVRAALNLRFDLVVADSLFGDLVATREQLETAGPLPFVVIAHSDLPVRPSDRLVSKPADAKAICDAVTSALGNSLGESVKLDGLTFDRPGQRLLSKSDSAQLTPIEFRLLDYLVFMRGQICSAEHLLQYVWHYETGTSSTDVVRSHMKNLRAKIRRLNEDVDVIETIPRRGYRLT